MRGGLLNRTKEARIQSRTKQAEISVRDILYVLFKHKTKLILVALIILTVGGTYVLMIPDLYTSEAKLALTREKDVTVRMITGFPYSNELNTEMELLQSRGLAEEVVAEVGIQTILFVPEQQVTSLKGKLKEAIQTGLNSVILTLKSLVRSVAALIDNSGRADGGTDNQADALSPEAAIRRFRESLTVTQEEQTNVISLYYTAGTPRHAQQILEKTVEIYLRRHVEIHRADVSLQVLAHETEQLRTILANSEQELRDFEDAVGLSNLADQEAELISRVQGLQRAIEDAEVNIASTRATLATIGEALDMRGRAREELIRLRSQEARLRELRRQILGAQNELQQAMGYMRTHRLLTTKVETNRANYNRYRTSLEQAQIAQTIESEGIPNMSVIEPPTYVPTSEGETRKLLVLVAAVATLASVGTAFLSQYFDHRISRSDDLQLRLGAPPLATIPRLAWRKRLDGLPASIISDLNKPRSAKRSLATSVVAGLHSDQEYRRAFETLRAELEIEVSKAKKATPYVIAITSVYRGEGVTSVALGAAHSLATTGTLEVGLVDANLHHEQADRIPASIRSSRLRRLRVRNGLPISVDRVLTVVGEMEQMVVVLDLPALTEGAVPLISAARADATVMVVESERIKEEVLELYWSKLEDSGANLLGVVLTKGRHYVPGWLYRHT